MYFIPAIGLFLADGDYAKRGWRGILFFLYQAVVTISLGVFIVKINS